MTSNPEINIEFPDYESVLARVEGRVGVVTLNRPDQMNAWDWLMSAEMNDAMTKMDDHDDVRAIVLTGAGKAFCAGAILRPAGQTFDGSQTPEAAQERYPGPLRNASQVRTPVIAAVNGHAAGAGLTMVMRCDIRIVADEAKLGFVFNRRGVVPDADLLWSLPREIGFAKAMDVLITGRIFNGPEAVRLGIASQSKPADQVLDTAMEMARDIATNVAPVSAAVTKLVGRRFLQTNDQQAALELERQLFRYAGQHPDAAEGVDAFKARRDPEWTMSKYGDFPDDLYQQVLELTNG